MSNHFLDDALRVLSGDGCVAVPSETVYGLAGNAYSEKAARRIFVQKQRPAFNPLIVHYVSADCAAADVFLCDRAKKCAQVFWPGPLTLVLNRRPESAVAPLVTAGLDSLAARVPAHPVFQALLQQCPFPLAAPSANVSGCLSATQADHVRRSFPDLPVLDGGNCAEGLESSVLDLRFSRPVLLRLGCITAQEISGVLGEKVMIWQAKNKGPDSREPSVIHAANAQGEKAKVFASPGLLPRHYAPQKPLRMNAKAAQQDEGVLAFGPAPILGGKITLNLSAQGCLKEAARQFFSFLHELDQSSVRQIAVMSLPKTGLGAALNDRLKRACA